MAIKLQLDDHLIKSRIIDIKRIKNEIVISAILDNKEKNFAIKFKEGQTEQETSDLLERKLNSPLGRMRCQYIIQFICSPENWAILSTSDDELKANAERQLIAEKYKPKHHFDTFEQWQVAVESAYHNLHKTVHDNMKQAWPAIEFVLSLKAILHIKEITLPYIGIILGPPSGVKSVALVLLNGRVYTFFTDDFNPRAMVSHVASLPPRMKEGDQHMLNKMKKMIRFLVTNVKIKAFEKITVVICLENVDCTIEDGNKIRMGIIATNIFEKQNVNSNKYDNQWLMIHHHGSSVANYMPPNVSA